MSDTKLTTTGCVVTVAAAPVLAVWHGFVLKVIWGWFMVPILGLPALTIAGAIGIGLVASYMTITINVKRHTDDPLEIILIGAVRPAFALAIGWVVKGFM